MRQAVIEGVIDGGEHENRFAEQIVETRQETFHQIEGSEKARLLVQEDRRRILELHEEIRAWARSDRRFLRDLQYLY